MSWDTAAREVCVLIESALTVLWWLLLTRAILEFKKEAKQMRQSTQDLLNAVNSAKTETAAFITAYQGIVSQLQAALASDDDAAVEQAVADLAANTQTMAAAFANNTPSGTSAMPGATSSAVPAVPPPTAVDAPPVTPAPATDPNAPPTTPAS